jgi:Fe2+ or Zn2+ uptake regulation protein
VDLETALRAHGCRVTRPRHVVWDVLTSTEHHLSAPEITEHAQARDPGINPSSVYRALALFAELDLVRESRVGGDASTWEPRHADSVIHLVCRQCGTVRHHHTELIDDLGRHLGAAIGFDADVIDVRVDGRCASCAAS